MQNIERNQSRFELILLVKEKKSSATAKCGLNGPWFETDVNIGEVVSVQGVWSEERRMFLVSASGGLIVTSPDTLISGTRVVGSLFCPRKAVLAERFQPLDSGDVAMVSYTPDVRLPVKT